MKKLMNELGWMNGQMTAEWAGWMRSWMNGWMMKDRLIKLISE